jgi:uncharacterized membrane protein YphA (DoxX/SURF4 family)
MQCSCFWMAGTAVAKGILTVASHPFVPKPVYTPGLGANIMRICLGRHVYGLAAIAFGVVALIWRDFNGWQQARVLGNIPHREILVYLAAALEIFGGIAIQWPRTARAGALALGTIYLIFALFWIPLIAEKPQIYDRWANLFEQFSLVSGALIVYASTVRNPAAGKVARLGYILFGTCVISFTLEQLFYLSGTAEFVPKWVPPGQMFWAITTTIAFGLAAIALLSGHSALLASRLLTAMIIGFGLLVWLPAPFADPHKLMNWAGNAENLAIAGSAWIVTDFLRQSRPG